MIVCSFRSQTKGPFENSYRKCVSLIKWAPGNKTIHMVLKGWGSPANVQSVFPPSARIHNSFISSKSLPVGNAVGKDTEESYSLDCLPGKFTAPAYTVIQNEVATGWRDGPGVRNACCAVKKTRAQTTIPVQQARHGPTYPCDPGTGGARGSRIVTVCRLPAQLLSSRVWGLAQQ